MSYVHFPVIAVMSLFLGAFVCAIFGKNHDKLCKAVGVLDAAWVFALIALIVKPVVFDGEIISYWMGNWSPIKGWAIGIGYEIDALGAFFALIVVFTVLMSVIYSIRYMDRDDDIYNYYTLLLMMSGSVLGLVLTGDVFNMFIMIEIMTFTAVGLTCFRNRSFGALEAGFKYLVIGSMGSSMTLLGIALLYAQCHTLNMAQLASILVNNTTPTSVLALALMFTGLGVKAYIVPFHMPAADSYAVAPTSVSMVFSGMVNKAGVYAIIRLVYILFNTMDKGSMQVLLTAFGAVTMFVGVTMALAQHDFKRLLAFHSISQIGYVITAIGLGSALGVTAGLFHALNHTLFKGLLFLCAGAVLYATGTTNLDKLGGLSKKMPKTTICFLVGAFSIAGMPPFNGFASKWMVYQAAFEKAVEGGHIYFAFITVVAVVVSVMTLASFIKVTQAVFFGQCPIELQKTEEVPFSMRLPMWIMSALCLLVGVFYDFVNKWFLAPATNAVLNATNYIDKMMGNGYAAAAGVENIQVAPAAFSFWNPLTWLVLFVVVFAAVAIVILTGKKSRGAVLETAENVDGKYATFFGGEASPFSHVSGSDLFWGFKKDWKGYFSFMDNLHSGIVNDYALWVVVALAIVTVWFNVFMK
ncbi:MAG: hypothetical protein MJ194_03205 [Clostridia bacterium]|nr:hypothetical protein [Clostridia bacterium]